MDAIRRYVMTLTAAAMLCALVKAVTAGRKGQEKILGLVCGIFLLATALGPLGLIRLQTCLTPRPRPGWRPARLPDRRRRRPNGR